MTSSIYDSFKLHNVLRRLLVRFPFFGTVMADLYYAATESISQVKTDGKTLWYNPQFLAATDPDLQLYYLMLPICQVAFRHQDRKKDRDPVIWEQATKTIINAWLSEEGITLPEGEILLPEAKNYDAESYYEDLFSKAPIPIMAQDNSHEAEPFEETDSSEPKSGKDILKGMTFSGGDMEAGREPAVFEKNRKMLEDRRRELMNSLARTAAEGGRDKAGNTTESRQIHLRGVMPRKPLIDWRQVLLETESLDLDWSGRHAVIEDGMIRNNLEQQLLPETEILLDTSGSIEEAVLRTFLEECRWILKISRIKIGCFDTEFYGFHPIHTLWDLQHFPVQGRGGTDFEVAVNSFSKNVDNRVIFTDGNGEFPKNLPPITWIIFGDEDVQPLHGRVIRGRFFGL